METYNRLVERMSVSLNLPVEEVERKIEAKRAKLSGLISKEGAAQIVAAELGVSFDNALLKIAELAEGMKRARAIGKITQMFPVRSYSKNGKEGKIGSFLLGDESSNIRTVLWDAHHIGLIEDGTLKVDSVVEVLNGGVRNGELHLGAFSDIKLSNEVLQEVQTHRLLASGKLREARVGMDMKVRATVVQIFEPRFFDSKQDPNVKRALFNAVIDDGSETMRCVFSNEQAIALGMDADKILDIAAFPAFKEALLGEERYFVGSFKNNAYFNKIEMSLRSVELVDVGALIKEFESAAPL
ncbi:MAG TPA: hypothetical protein VJK07_00130 [Candidatus Nanoarchaeia archaeon]|nr:hypothetical protein [Candidatus Nanoarchaeia archaeon]